MPGNMVSGLPPGMAPDWVLYHGKLLDIETTGCDVRGHQDKGFAGLEIAKSLGPGVLAFFLHDLPRPDDVRCRQSGQKRASCGKKISF